MEKIIGYEQSKEDVTKIIQSKNKKKPKINWGKAAILFDRVYNTSWQFNNTASRHERKKIK
jgi:hypothetical protein